MLKYWHYCITTTTSNYRFLILNWQELYPIDSNHCGWFFLMKGEKDKDNRAVRSYPRSRLKYFLTLSAVSLAIAMHTHGVTSRKVKLLTLSYKPKTKNPTERETYDAAPRVSELPCIRILSMFVCQTPLVHSGRRCPGPVMVPPSLPVQWMVTSS